MFCRPLDFSGGGADTRTGGTAGTPARVLPFLEAHQVIREDLEVKTLTFLEARPGAAGAQEVKIQRFKPSRITSPRQRRLPRSPRSCPRSARRARTRRPRRPRPARPASTRLGRGSGTRPRLPRYAVRTARPRLVRVPSTYRTWGPGGKPPCTRRLRDLVEPAGRGRPYRELNCNTQKLYSG